MTREEFKIRIKNDDLQWRKGSVDPKMKGFGNAMHELERAVSTIGGQYRNADKDLFDAIYALNQAYKNLESAYKNSKRDYATVDDIVGYMRPDYVSVDNVNGGTLGSAQVDSFDVEADVDGVHMYVRIKQD